MNISISKNIKKKSIASVATILLGVSMAGGVGYVLATNSSTSEHIQAIDLHDQNGYWNINDFGARPNDPNFDNAKVFKRIFGSQAIDFSQWWLTNYDS